MNIYFPTFIFISWENISQHLSNPLRFLRQIPLNRTSSFPRCAGESSRDKGSQRCSPSGMGGKALSAQGKRLLRFSCSGREQLPAGKGSEIPVPACWDRGLSCPWDKEPEGTAGSIPIENCREHPQGEFSGASPEGIFGNIPRENSREHPRREFQGASPEGIVGSIPQGEGRTPMLLLP